MFKDQNSLIVFIVSIVLGAIGLGVVYFTKPDPVAPVPPEAVPLTPAKLPDPVVSMENALPNAGSGQAGGQGGPGAPSTPSGPGGGGAKKPGLSQGRA